MEIVKTDEKVGLGLKVKTFNAKGNVNTDSVADMLFEADVGFDEWLIIENISEINTIIENMQ